MTLTPEAPHVPESKVVWNVAKIPGSEVDAPARLPIDYDAIPRLRDMTPDEIREELSLRDDIPAEEKAAALAYEPIRDAWDNLVERDVDLSLDKRASEARLGPKPQGLTPYELLEKYNSRKRTETRRTEALRQQLEEIERAGFSSEERIRRIREVALKDKQKQLENNSHNPDYVYFLPEIFDVYPY
jgi:hypothetical protein